MKQRQTEVLSDQFLLPNWVLDRIMSANFRLTTYMVNSLAVTKDLAAVFDTEHEDIAKLRDDYETASLIFGTPFVTFLPTLPSAEDWRCYIQGRTPTAPLSKLEGMMPALTLVQSMQLEQANRAYITALYDVLNMSVLAAPLLGMSVELAEYLRSVPQHKVDLAIAERRIPLFKWRLSNRLFWFEAAAGRLTSDMVAHYLMDNSPIRSDRLPHSGPWGNFHLSRFARLAYCEGFIRLRCRAKSVAALFDITPDKMREMYLRIHGESSPSGQQPASAVWYLESASRRVQSTMLIWLFRSALAEEASVPEAFICAMDISRRLFGDEFMPAERAFHLSRSMSTDEDLAIRSCRSCSTPYLASNTAPKIELAQSFQCPCCSGALSSPNSPLRRKQRGRPRKASDATKRARFRPLEGDGAGEASN
ncbi:conserved protein of unknown function (plasmid) [Cupriavidus taiwanensis]|uniref:Transcriptional activator FlhC n=1 Tax=Cupriavidus taiwanensis TaxID=164546 RepID=A0A375ITG1_9BURK|nr:FlhC family transcriptional regulator [Cupriavidus taiwanensis]SPK77431.1 conserved protein of unknown function [Cupriavidus taiwanensis]